MTALKNNLLLLIIGLALTGCSDQVQTNAKINSATTASIVNGVLSNEAFQQQNGVVGLIGLSVESIYIKPDGSIDPKAQYSVSICSGTLIDKKVVLTAAHCVVSLNPQTTIVAIAVNFKLDLTDVLTTFDFKDAIFANGVIINQDFLKGITGTTPKDAVSWNDIALLRLQADAPSTIQFAKLATAADVALIDSATKATLSGFGVATAIVNKIVINPFTKKPEIVAVPEKVPTSGILRQVEDQTILGTIADAGKDIILDQSKGAGACHGDSGGPAFFKQTDGTLLQIGVASRGTEQIGNCTEKSLYTNVAAQRTWIDAAVQSLLAPEPTEPANPTAPTQPTEPTTPTVPTP